MEDESRRCEYYATDTFEPAIWTKEEIERIEKRAKELAKMFGAEKENNEAK